MKKLAIINYQAIRLYYEQGWSKERLGQYYNPNNFFDEVNIYAFQESMVKITDSPGWNISDNIHVHACYDFKKTFQKIVKFSPDIIRCYECNHPYALFALEIAKSLDIPSYLSLHDSRKILQEYIVQYTVITAYDDLLSKNASLLLNRSVEIQYNGVDSTFFCPEDVSYKHEHTYRITTIGRKDSVKNMDTMIFATKGFSHQISKLLKHILIGPDTDKMNFDKKIHFGLGSTNESDIKKYLEWSNCHLQTELVPEIGMSHTEAMMMKTPLITSALIPKEIGIHVPIEKARGIPLTINALCKLFETKYDLDYIRSWAIERYDAQKLRKLETNRYKKLCT